MNRPSTSLSGLKSCAYRASRRGSITLAVGYFSTHAWKRPQTSLNSGRCDVKAVKLIRDIRDNLWSCPGCNYNFVRMTVTCKD